MSTIRGVLNRFVLRLALFGGTAGILLGVFEGSDHRVHVLPADASALGVVAGALVFAVVASVLDEAMRRRRW